MKPSSKSWLSISAAISISAKSIFHLNMPPEVWVLCEREGWEKTREREGSRNCVCVCVRVCVCVGEREREREWLRRNEEKERERDSNINKGEWSESIFFELSVSSLFPLLSLSFPFSHLFLRTLCRTENLPETDPWRILVVLRTFYKCWQATRPTSV